MESNRKQQIAADVVLGLLGLIIIGIVKVASGSWSTALMYGTVVSIILWIMVRTEIGKRFIDFLMMFFAWCGGVPRADLEAMSPKDQLQYARTGATLLVPTTLAFCGAWFVASDVYGAPIAACMGVAFVWAWIIFTIDAALIATMKRDREMKYPLTSLVIRGILAFALGVLISSVLELRVFKKEIKQEFEEQLQSSKSTMDSAETADIAVFQKRIDEASAQIDAREFEMRHEMDQSIGGRGAGYGSMAKKKEAMWLQSKEEFETKTLPDLMVKIQERKDYYAKRRDATQESFSDGLASRLEYLSDAGKKHPTIATAHFFLFLFLIALELIPVIAKMMAPPTEYEHKKAQLGYEEEGNTCEKLKEIQDAEFANWQNLMSHHRLKAEAAKDLEYDLESKRISAVIKDMENIDKYEIATGGKRDMTKYSDFISDRIINPSGETKKSWFWQKRKEPFA